MQSLGLSDAEYRAYFAALSATHKAAVEVRVLDLSGNLINSLKPTINSGQVNVDADQEVTRSATMSFNDRSGSLQFLPDSPNDSALYFNRMIQVVYGVHVPALARRVDVAAFTGPLVTFTRTGWVVDVEAQGKESLALNGVPTMVARRGKNAVDAIHDFLSERVGETRFAFPTLPNRLPKDTVVSWEPEVRPWIVCKKIAKSLGLHLFYDGAGTCRLQDEPGQPVVQLFTGKGGNVTSLVKVSHDKDKIKNRSKVTGSRPAHTATAILRDSSMSPTSLAVNGVPQYLSADPISDNKIRSKAAAQARANKVIAPYATLTFPHVVNTVPIPHLDELDLAHIDTPEYVGSQQLRQWSFPITGGDMTVGSNQLVTLPRRDI